MQRGNLLHGLKGNKHSNFDLLNYTPVVYWSVFLAMKAETRNYWRLMFSNSSLIPSRLGVRWRSVKAHIGIFKVQGKDNDGLFAFSLLWLHDGVQMSRVYSNINFYFLPFLSFFCGSELILCHRWLHLDVVGGKQWNLVEDQLNSGNM